MTLRTRLRPIRYLALLLPLLWTACEGTSITGPEPVATTSLGIVMNSVERTLTIFEVDDPVAPTRTVGLGPDGTPVGLSVRGEWAVVPMGTVPVAVVVDLRSGSVVHNVPLPEGSGATGSAFLNDSIALVANPGRNTVSSVNVLRGTVAAEVETGRFPQAILVEGGKVFVVNSELESFVPVGPGTVTVLDAQTLAHRSTIQLSGENSGPIVAGGGGRLFVVNGGIWGAGNGSLSVLDGGGEAEVGHHEGFGDFPGSAAISDDETLFVASWSFGVIAWNTGSETFERGPGSAIHPDGVPSAPGVGVDGEGRLYTLFPECEEPSRLFRLAADYSVEMSVPVGICPTGVVFTEIEEG